MVSLPDEVATLIWDRLAATSKVHV
jgi:hypothetical protein